MKNFLWTNRFWRTVIYFYQLEKISNEKNPGSQFRGQKISFLGPRLQRSMDEFQHKINFEIKQKLRHQIFSISIFWPKFDNFWSKFSQRSGSWKRLNFKFKDLICMDFIFGQNNRYSSKINRFEYKQWRFFQNWIKKNEIMNLYWIDTTLINIINVSRCLVYIHKIISNEKK